MLRSHLLALALAGLTAAAGIVPSAAAAQDSRFSVELRGSLNRPLGDFGDADGLEADGEASLAGDLFIHLNDNLSVYGGYAREMFGCESCTDDEGFHASGFEGGVKLMANRQGRILPWLRGGLIAQELTADFSEGEVSSDTGIGFQIAAGVDIPLGEVLSFSPALRYQTFDADFDVVDSEFVDAEATVQHLALDFGLHIHPGALMAR